MTKTLIRILTLGGAFAFAGLLPAAASVVVDDTFSTDQSSNYARWNNDGTTDMTLDGTGGNLSVGVTGTSNGDRILVRSFAPVTLTNVGDSITFSVDFYVSNAANPIRFGLYNIETPSITDGSLTSTSANKEGYFTFFYNGNTTNAVLRRDYEAGTTTIMTSSATGTGSSPSSRPYVVQLATSSQNISFTGAANLATMTLTVTKLSDGNNQVESSISKGGVVTSYMMTADETDGLGLDTFNTISLLTFSTTTTYDNIRVEYISAIPEPCTYALIFGALAGLTVLMTRRRRC